MSALALGIEIGGTKLQAGVCGARGGLRQLVRVDVRRQDGRAGILEQLQQIVPPLIRRFQPQALGIGFGGPVDPVAGRVLCSHHVSGWETFPLRRWATRRFGLPVVLENDANCAGLAEARVGAGRGRSRVFYFNVGTGIGGALVVNGRLEGGRFGGGELGHTRIRVADRWRTLESVASGLALEQEMCTVRQSAERVAVAVANAIALWNPEVVVAGGGVVSGVPRYLARVRAGVRRIVFKAYRANHSIVPAMLGESVVVVGAALVAGLAPRRTTR